MDKRVKVLIIRDDNREFQIDGADWRIPSDGLDGFGDINNDITTVDNAVGDGGIITADRVAQKDRTITAISRNPAVNSILRKTALSFFNPKSSYKIYLTYMGVTRWCEGRLYRFDLPAANVYRQMRLTVTFLCPNPFLKSYDDFGKNIAALMPMSGFPYLCSITPGTPIGIVGGRFNFAKAVDLSNDGDVETYCRAVLYASGEVVNPKLTINDNYVRILDTMVDGDVIEIDFTKNPPTVRKNGVNCIGKCDRTSAFDEMALIVGISVVQYDADTGSNLMDVSIYYNKLYSAI